jgi:LPXTG-motif cell wall-anchored protein
VIQGTDDGDGMVTPPELIVPETPGITYTPDPPPPYAPGDLVTLIAELDDGFAWVDPMPPGWTRVDPDTATFAVIFTTAPPERLPATGSFENDWILLAAASALIAGFGFVAASRRR